MMRPSVTVLLVFSTVWSCPDIVTESCNLTVEDILLMMLEGLGLLNSRMLGDIGFRLGDTNIWAKDLFLLLEALLAAF